MADSFASGRYARATCDICGFKVNYKDLKRVMRAGYPTNVFACDYCWDKDHPQLFLGRKPIKDPMSLRRARPDSGLLESRAMFDRVQFKTPPIGINSGALRQSGISASGPIGSATLLRNAAANPWGEQIADVLVDTAVATLHAAWTRVTFTANANVTITMMAGPSINVATIPEMIIRINDTANVNVATGVFNLSTRSWVGAGFSAGTGALIGTGTVNELPNGWANYTVVLNLGSGITVGDIYVAPRSGGTASYVGTGVQCLNIFGDPVVV